MQRMGVGLLGLLVGTWLSGGCSASEHRDFGGAGTGGSRPADGGSAAGGGGRGGNAGSTGGNRDAASGAAGSAGAELDASKVESGAADSASGDATRDAPAMGGRDAGGDGALTDAARDTGGAGNCDLDGDGERAAACGGPDCNDHNPNVKTTATFQTAPIPGETDPVKRWDYDCSGTVEKDIDACVQSFPSPLPSCTTIPCGGASYAQRTANDPTCTCGVTHPTSRCVRRTQGSLSICERTSESSAIACR